MLIEVSAYQPSAAASVGAYTHRHQRHSCAYSTHSGGLVAAACMLLGCLSGSVAGLTCDDTLGVTMMARHYNYDLVKMPDWSDKACVDAEETRTVADASWPVSASDDFVMTIDGTDYDTNVGVVFEAYFDIPIPFSKFFQLNSTDGSKLFIDDDLVVDHSGLHDFIGSKTQKWPLNGPKRFKITVQYFKGAVPSGTGLVVSWGDLRQLYPTPIASSELKLRPCSAAVPAPLPTPGHNGHPVKRTLPKACGGHCAHGPQHRRKRPPPSAVPRTLPPACHGKCNKKVQHKRTLPKACGGRCATMKPKIHWGSGKK